MVFVSFEKKQSARTGNILFQYLQCKLISHLFGHQYIPIEEIASRENVIVMDDAAIENLHQTKDDPSVKKNTTGQNIILDGFFQKSEYYIPYRDSLLCNIKESDDYWIGCNGQKQHIKDFFCFHSPYSFAPCDVLISLRLDDFIQLPRETSDIIPPDYYLNILENMYFDNLYIVCDTIRHDWEKKYLEFFGKWKPVLIQGNLLNDCAVMRDAPILLHSNSTLCWFMSFLSTNKTKRFIPQTNFYGGQSLGKIDEQDVLTNVSPMPHHDVYSLDLHAYLKKYIYPLSYCIPDECVANFLKISIKKTKEIASLIPGQTSTYTFGPEQEKEYNEMYQESLFAITHKKGGWDCLRHYEIIANGCIPIFNGLDNCPPQTLTTLPKDFIQEAHRVLMPWNYNNKPVYDFYLKQIMKHFKENCTCSATAKYFLSKMPMKPKNILLIRGNCGVNYTRELFWIGMKRYIQSLSGVAVEYPKMDFLYKNYTGNKKDLYGNGFTYSCRLDDDYSFTEEEIIEKIQNHFFDLIIYGKVGPDELFEGSHPNMPLWNHVFKKYGKKEIVFLYGGDECIDLTYDNKYKQHIMYHSQFAQCFVRELHM